MKQIRQRIENGFLSSEAEITVSLASGAKKTFSQRGIHEKGYSSDTLDSGALPRPKRCDWLTLYSPSLPEGVTTRELGRSRSIVVDGEAFRTTYVEEPPYSVRLTLAVVARKEAANADG